MKKQYRVSNNIGFKKYFYVYHDGVLVDTLSVWEGEDLGNLRKYFQDKGYTMGYTEDEIYSAKILYENRLKNKLIEPKGE